MDNSLLRSRAWVEVDLDALSHNIDDMKTNMPKDCGIMAVLKSNAYGHGAKPIAERLYTLGVNFFAVACLAEAIELREVVPYADILILGYTSHKFAQYLNENNFIQSVFDVKQAKALESSGYKIRIHIAIDTGMHRYGFDPEDMSDIESVFQFDNLKVEGTATHFASADSLIDDDVKFTKGQMDKFMEVVNALRGKGIDAGKLHAQSSYAIYNHPDMKCDYVRPGIMLYGVQSQNDETKIKTNLKPILSVKAIVSQVRWIKAGETVSYSRVYTTEEPIKLVSVAIGYADGIPRHMTGKDGVGGMCIINGCKLPIVGRVCMDTLLVDATELENVEAGDVATLIGRDGDEVIHCEEVAEVSGTITNDILSRLGIRLPRIYV